jgi:hypothetical protein
MSVIAFRLRRTVITGDNNSKEYDSCIQFHISAEEIVPAFAPEFKPASLFRGVTQRQPSRTTASLDRPRCGRRLG